MEQLHPTTETQTETVCQQRFLWEGISVWVTMRPEPGELEGIVGSEWTGYYGFHGTLDWIHVTDWLLNQMQVPKETHQMRTFAATHQQQEAWKRRRDALNSREDSEKVGQPGGIPTFVVQVRYRQNATWQGNIKWVEARQTRNFRSALELLNLMDEAMSTNESGAFASWECGEDAEDEVE